MSPFVVLFAIAAVCSLLGWVAYLIFLSKIQPEHYKDAAVAVKAFRFSGFASLAKALIKALAYLKAKTRSKDKSDA
ncbi:hypothetical protein SAMN05660642_01693 [Geodermatophilus siccatus]|uniref:Uncharacterized protein n=1 Tax=Geodermatophilus siccatus TaxID=1137991 RepID=A0A1G9QIP6_9ACTN|nr:hypothetical protein [Geodermatophilus siccatus]SDM10924.1 hypothetical protein SAMN05660642_01693 [Geodermatophilus siccatus]